MLDPRYKKNVTVGSTVRIDLNADLDFCDIITGIVKTVLTKEHFCKDGISVIIESGEQGNVTEIIDFVAPTYNSDEELILEGESEQIELKESLLLDCKRYKKTGEKVTNDDLLFNLPKGIAGFANSFGGVMYFGVADDLTIMGLEIDYELLQTDADGFENFCKTKLRKFFKNDKSIIKNIHLEMLKIKGKDVFKVTVRPSKTPFIVSEEIKIENHKPLVHPYFFVRSGNGTEDLSAQDFLKYWNEHVLKI